MIKFVPKDSTKSYFFEKYKIPGVIGCVDGTHIMIIRPTENENMFFNRKGRHSINAMVICDENTHILAINGRYGGSAHDSFVWRQSEKRNALERDSIAGRSSSWLLETFLLTPYRSVSEDSPESHFNLVHSKARSIVERCIGRLKGRWRIILEERKCKCLCYIAQHMPRLQRNEKTVFPQTIQRKVEMPSILEKVEEFVIV